MTLPSGRVTSRCSPIPVSTSPSHPQRDNAPLLSAANSPAAIDAASPPAARIAVRRLICTGGRSAGDEASRPASSLPCSTCARAARLAASAIQWSNDCRSSTVMTLRRRTANQRAASSRVEFSIMLVQTFQPRKTSSWPGHGRREPQDGLGDMLLDHADADTHALRDLCIAQIAEAVQLERVSAAGRQRLDRLGHHGQFLPCLGRPIRAGLGVGQGVVDGQVSVTGDTPGTVDPQIAQNPFEIVFSIADGAGLAGFEHAQASLLDPILGGGVPVADRSRDAQKSSINIDKIAIFGFILLADVLVHEYCPRPGSPAACYS